MKAVTLENTWKLCHLTFLFLLGMAVFFAVERACYMDSAFMLFRLVNSEHLIAEGGRLVNIFPQFIPYLMVKAGCSLMSIVIAFSLMYTTVLYIIFTLIGNWLNQKKIALIFLLILILSVNETFFDVVTETKFALAFACLFLALVLSDKKRNWIAIVFTLLCGFFSHPIFIIYFGINVFYNAIEGELKLSLKYLFIGATIVLFKALISGVTIYENDLISSLYTNTFSLFKVSFIHEYFEGLFGTQFVVFVGLFLMLILNLVFLKKWGVLLAYLTMVFTLYFILAIVYSKGDSHMMIQKTLFVFHFALLCPYLIVRNIKFNAVFYMLIIVGIIVGLMGILETSQKYTNRVLVINQFMQHLPSTSDKFLIKENQINHELIMGTWALPHETILLSKIGGNRALNLKNFKERNDTLFLSKFPNAMRPAYGYPMMNKGLNTNYFKFDEQKSVMWLDSTYVLGVK